MRTAVFEVRSSTGGFTLVELLVVMATIGILAAISIPTYMGVQKRAKNKSAIQTAQGAKSELSSWLSANAAQEEQVADLNCDGSLDGNDSWAAYGGVGADVVTQRYAAVSNPAAAPSTACAVTNPWIPMASLFEAGPICVGGSSRISLTPGGPGPVPTFILVTVCGSDPTEGPKGNGVIHEYTVMAE